MTAEPFKPGDKPRPTGKPPRAMTLTGMLIPWMETEPAYVFIANGDDDPMPALAIFTTAERLRASMKELALTYAGIKQIEDGPEFMTGIPSWLLIVVDPHLSERGTVIYTQVLRD